MTTPSLQGCRVLVVDDDAADRKVILRALRRAPGTFLVHEANTVTSGLELLTNGATVDCLVVDYRLPDGDASTLLARIHDSELGFTTVPVVVVTGAEDEQIGASSLQLGAQEYLCKSDVNTQTLTRAIRYAIERHALRRSLHDQEQQFRQASKLESIGQLAGGIAHDFNNMLTVIIGSTSRILQRLDRQPSKANSGETRVDLENVLRAAERSAELTQQILAFSRKQTLTTQVVDLAELVKETELLLGRILGEQLALECELETGAFVNVDAAQVGQVIMNLTLNARDSMPNGGKVTLGVGTAPGAEESTGLLAERHVRLTVSDTGCGITPEDLEHVFDPFFTTKKAGEGTGLGLSVVHGIVSQSGGTISVHSTPGQGTTFEVAFPFAEQAEVAHSTCAAAEQPSEGGETILLVEDEDLVRALIEETLKIGGFQVLAAGTAREARELCQAHAGPIHLLLSDLVLPAARGEELASDLRRERPSMRVLFMSGYSRGEDPGATDMDPGAHFIQKPMRPRELHAKVREVLKLG